MYPAIAMMLAIVFLLTPAAFLPGSYNRTSKNVVGVFLTALLWFLHYEETNHRLRNHSILSSVVIFFFTLAMGMTDEIGVLFSIVISAFLFFQAVWKQTSRRTVTLFISSLLGVLGIFLYRNVVSPAITTSVVGFRPTPWGDISLSGLSLVSLWNGMCVLLIYANQLAGSIGFWVLIPIMFFSFLIVAYRQQKSQRIILGVFVITIFSILSTMVALMIKNIIGISTQNPIDPANWFA
jgi:hypothetical protein